MTTPRCNGFDPAAPWLLPSWELWKAAHRPYNVDRELEEGLTSYAKKYKIAKWKVRACLWMLDLARQEYLYSKLSLKEKNKRHAKGKKARKIKKDKNVVIAQLQATLNL